MSDLQIGLIALGVLFVVVVLVINIWQDFRARRKMRAHLPDPSHDPLLPGKNSILGGYGDSHGERLEPAFIDRAKPDKDEPDPVIEAVIDLIFNEAVSGEELIPFVQGIRHAGQKPMRVFATTTEHLHRSGLHPTESYRSLQVAVLLANRGGHLDKREWDEAVSRVRVLADQFDGQVEAPDENQVLQRALDLDQLCADLDLQVGLSLIAKAGAWDIDTILKVTQYHGFSNIMGGKLQWIDERGVNRFSLTRVDAHPMDSIVHTEIKGLNLLFDVPRTPAMEEGFSSLVQIARNLAEELNAHVVDDNGRILAPGMEQVIDKHLLERYQQLENHGLTAGLPRALRVFSYPNKS